MMIFDLVDRLSLSFCQLEVRHLLTRESADNDSCCAVSTTLLDAVKSSVEKGNHAWFELVDGLDSALISKVRAMLEVVEQILTQYRSVDMQSASYWTPPVLSTTRQLQRIPDPSRKIKR